MNIEVILNANSGAGSPTEIRQRLAEAFKAGGADPRIWLAGNGVELINLAQRTARSDADIVVAGGGDGTINLVATTMIDSGKTLGVLPFGTMNHFAKDLAIPLDLEGAVATIIAGHAISVDVGEVNGRIFLNNSSLGLYPRIIRERERQQRLGWGKWPAYLWAAIGVLRRYPFLDIRLDVDGKALTGRTPFVFVGNNAYDMERLDIGGRACLDKGELSLYMASGTGRLGLIRLALRALLGGLRQDRDFMAFATEDVWIGTRHRRVRVALDGEVTIMEPPLHYRVRPGALRVLAPVHDRAH
ncbi:MAG: diacylglycerol kinase family lipid kinase [Acidobacteria bacterium]|nr:diacylglycerol kinase family lipid kinase [Acidobacteriota bacterium]